MLWLKFIHIGAIAIWIAGLFYLSALLAGHDTVQDRQDFARVRMASRFAYTIGEDRCKPGRIGIEQHISRAIGALAGVVADHVDGKRLGSFQPEMAAQRKAVLIPGVAPIGGLVDIAVLMGVGARCPEIDTVGDRRV